MRSVVRLLLLWLLALALPVQGIAAATQLHCGRTQEPPAAHAHHHHMDEAAADGHHAHSPGHADGHSAAGCSACAACCMGLALPSLPLVLASQKAARATPPAATFPAPLFLTGGPERPPRTTLA